MATYYVATDGNDNGNGGADSPWRTISHAMQAQLQPGDEVIVRPGTYNEAVNINQDGTLGNNIVLRSEVPGEAKISAPSSAWNAVSINANYVTIDGFDITSAGGGDGIEANSVHHIDVLNNTVHDNGESGIQFNYSEFIRIEGNTTYGNASDGWFSGISIYQNRNVSGDTSTDGYRTIVRNNVSYDNVTESGQHTDGNGIIIDDFQSTQTSGYPSYTYPTLVENNLVHDNGGKGIQVTWSDFVTVRNNTAYHNNVDDQNSGTWRGELSNSQSSNNTWVNNIAIVDPSENSNNRAIDSTSYGGYTNDNVVWENNITYTGTDGQASVRTDGGNSVPSSDNMLGVDPMLVNPEGGNFQLQDGSPAIDSGTEAYGVASSDLDGGDRTVGTVDVGAYEDGSGSSSSSTGGSSSSTGGSTDTSGGTTDTSGGTTDTSGGTTGTSGGTGTGTSGGTSTGTSGGSTGGASTGGTTDTSGGTTDTSGGTTDTSGGSKTTTDSGTTNDAGADSQVFHLWDDAVKPQVLDDADSNAVELGVTVTAEVDGQITGLRFYQGQGGDGTHTGHIWGANGELLAEATFTPSNAEGWQEVTFDEPIQVSAGEKVIASYHAPQGSYAVSEGYFDSAYQNGPLTVEKDGGVYAYGDGSTAPDHSYQGSNYWIDLAFEQINSGATETAVMADDTTGATSETQLADATVQDAAATTTTTADQPADTTTADTTADTTVADNSTGNHHGWWDSHWDHFAF